MVPYRPHDRRQFLVGGALSAAALAGADVAQARASKAVYGAVVEEVLSPTALSVFVPDLGASRTLVLDSGVGAVHGRAGVVTTLEAFRAGEKVVFISADGSVEDEQVTVSELSSLVTFGTIDVSSDGTTVRSSRGSFHRSANLRRGVPLGRVDATYWVDPSTGERYLCAAERAG
jgi:hypothetical protein